MATRNTVLVSLVLMASACLASSPADMHCTAARSSSVRFSINSRRNLTGHWLTQVQLLHGQDGSDGVVNEEARPWDVDVFQSSVVCEGQEMVNISVSLSSPPRRPSPGYELFPRVSYYKFHSVPDTWLKAREMCSKEGGHLVIVNSQPEDNVVIQLFAEYGNIAGASHVSLVFAGFHDRYTEGEYVTIFGKPLSATGFARWSNGQPDNAGKTPGEDCGTIYKGSGLLNDYVCEAKLPYICEQELW